MLHFRPALAAIARRSLCLGVFVLLATSALASPEPTDGVSRYLIENGLLNAPVSNEAPAPKPESPLVSRIRDKASDMVLTAMNFLGVPYRRGGSSAERGFDCSGFTRHVFEMSVGLVLPRRVDAQAAAPGLIKVKREELKPGDLVFFNTLKRTFSHVGIYVGEGKFIHSPRPGGEVRVEDMRFAYWAKRFTGARRAEQSLAATTPETGVATPATPVLVSH
ncbi:MAG: C40 family peptidase [Burkholderiales bacterium]